MNKFLYQFAILFFAVSLSFAQPAYYTVETVPNPKSQDGGYISDPQAVLSPEQKSELNALLAGVEKKTTDQVAIVILNSIGDDVVPKDFANLLFEKWGIGQKDKDNGLLLLVVIDQRRMEIETGYGLEPILPDAICKRIEIQEMVPLFKEEKYGEGIINGIKAVQTVLEDPKNNIYANAVSEDEKDPEIRGNKEGYKLGVLVMGGLNIVVSIIILLVTYSKSWKTAQRLTKGHAYIYYVFVPLILHTFFYFNWESGNRAITWWLVMYAYIFAIMAEKRISKNIALKKKNDGDLFHSYQDYIKNNEGMVWGVVFFPVPYLLYFFWYLKTKYYLRNGSRECAGCHQAMLKLSEKNDDTRLSKTQVLEEGLRSVDYDVWHCPNCDSVKILSYINAGSKYEACPSCKVRAYYLFKDETLNSATYSSRGSGRTTHKCKSCEKEVIKNYVIPVRVRSSYSSRPGSSSSFSSGGSSFGGGHSGGGGAGSSW